VELWAGWHPAADWQSASTATDKLGKAMHFHYWINLLRKAFPLGFVFLSGGLLAQQPAVMTRVEVVLQGPDVPAGSFATKPRVMYRAGSRYCRTEEAPDMEHEIQGLAIVNEPDYWMVNLIKKTAQHAIDPGPTFNCHLPIFPDVDKNLEFGLEPEYFKSKGASRQQGPILQGKQTTLYKVDVGDATLALFTYGISERPMAVSRVRRERGDIFWFRGWGDLPFDAKLFAKPEGVKISDQDH
jgi:hypothetical protein